MHDAWGTPLIFNAENFIPYENSILLTEYLKITHCEVKVGDYFHYHFDNLKSIYF